MAIDFQHKEYKANIDKWKLTDNICSSKNVKQYLIELNPSDQTKENKARNKAYKERAVLYPVAGYTLQGLIGLLFTKDPKIELPSQLEYMKNNCDGSGVSIYQQAQDSGSNVMKKARSGLFVSYPKTEGAISRAQMAEGGYLATINKIEADQIINWGFTTKGSEIILSFVVIKEVVEIVDDYEVKEVEQIRELALIENVFTVREWRKNDKDEWIIHGEPLIPTNAKGSTWNRIPFTFIGSQSNSATIDEAPMYPLAEINKAHYRNSADYEDSVWYVGQAQPWMSGINQTHLDLMKKNNMYIGSRSLFGVPSGETFGFASADPNPLVRQAMLDKLEMMIGLGARFIQENGTVKTATESNNDEKSENSILSTISTNLSEGYTQALKWAAEYMGADSSSIIFETSKEFVSHKASAQELQQIIAGFIQGAIPMESYFRWMQKYDFVDSEKTIDEFAEEVSKVDMPDLSTDNG